MSERDNTTVPVKVRENYEHIKRQTNLMELTEAEKDAIFKRAKLNQEIINPLAYRGG